MKRRFFTACAVFALLSCCVLALRLLAAPKRPDDKLPALDLPVRNGPTLAFFGSSTDPWAEPLSGQLDQWAREQGWRLIRYDCKGNPITQKAQVDDLIRSETADVALVCPLAADDADETGLEALAGRLAPLFQAKIPVVTLSPRSAQPPAEAVICHIGPGEGQPYAAAADFFGPGEALLMADLPDDGWIEEAQRVLGGKSVSVPGYGACWSVAQYAGEYVERALAIWPGTDRVLAAGLEGALGAKEALKGRAGAKVLCLADSPQARDALALGRIDGLVTLSEADAMDALKTVLPQIAEGKAPASRELKVTVLTG